MKILQTKTKQETLQEAKNFAQTLRGGEVIGLIGPLGAGKTVFTKGLGRALGIKQTIGSPTFVLMNIYNVKHSKIKKLVHIDAYRLKTKKELFNIGAFDYFAKPDTVVVVEWPDKILGLTEKIKTLIKINN